MLTESPEVQEQVRDQTFQFVKLKTMMMTKLKALRQSLENFSKTSLLEG